VSLNRIVFSLWDAHCISSPLSPRLCRSIAGFINGFKQTINQFAVPALPAVRPGETQPATQTVIQSTAELDLSVPLTISGEPIEDSGVSWTRPVGGGAVVASKADQDQDREERKEEQSSDQTFSLEGSLLASVTHTPSKDEASDKDRDSWVAPILELELTQDDAQPTAAPTKGMLLFQRDNSKPASASDHVRIRAIRF